MCPECGEEAMLRKAEKEGWYTLKCEMCGAERGPFPDAEDMSVA